MEGNTQPLAQAQQRLFDKMGREYDNREYAKSLRTAESILSTNPEHADTTAMKGLTLHNLDRKDEAYEWIRKAIILNPKSTIAWHCLGMCQRNDKKFADALKAFKRACVTDPDNGNVMRDVSSAAVQLRDWPLFLDTREKMVTKKAGVRANWIALACAHKMMGNPGLAASVMEIMTSIMDAGDAPVEASEAYLFRAEMELDSGSPQKAIEVLKKFDAAIVDHETKMILRAKAHAQLGQRAEAEKRFMEVVALGVSEADSIAAMAKLRNIELDGRLLPVGGEGSEHVKNYMALAEQVLAACPKCDYMRRHLLDCVPVAQLKERLAAFATPYIKRMIPSLFSVLQSLYDYPDRAAIVGELFLEMEADLDAKKLDRFGGEANPCYMLWVYTFLASHFRRIGDLEKAMAYITKAIDHTPTLELLYLEKAAILTSQGKTTEAAAEADKARLLDLQDKYLNTEATKYFLRDNNIEAAESTMQLFYKNSVVGGRDTFLVALESQCSWYEKEVGEAFYRRGDYVSALQNLLMFEFHHRQNINELSDFHNYVFRRNTMRGWFDVLETQDNMGRNKFFLTFCPGLVRTYMKIHELGEEAVRAAHKPRPDLGLEGEGAAALGEDEAKRLRQLWSEYYLTNVDLSEPLKKAARYMSDLLTDRSADVATHQLAVEYYTLLGKPLLVLRALMELKKLGVADSMLAELVSSFEKGIGGASLKQQDSRVQAVASSMMATLAK